MSKDNMLNDVIVCLAGNFEEGISKSMIINILQGSRAAKVISFVRARKLVGYHGILSVVNSEALYEELESLIDQQLLEIGQVQGKWGVFPIVRLASKGHNLLVDEGIMSTLEPVLKFRELLEEQANILEPRDEEIIRRYSRQPSQSAMETAELLRKGYALEQIASDRGLSINTISNHIIRLAGYDDEFNISLWVNTTDEQHIHQAIEQVGFKRLKEIKDQLQDDNISYFEIGLVRSKYMRTLAKGA